MSAEYVRALTVAALERGDPVGVWIAGAVGAT
jgi:hypothetical protein